MLHTIHLSDPPPPPHLCVPPPPSLPTTHRLLAFLREEEERERLEEIERLKPIGTSVGSYMEYRLKSEVGGAPAPGGAAAAAAAAAATGGKGGEGAGGAGAGEAVVVDNRAWVRRGHTATQVRGAGEGAGGISYVSTCCC
jgi:hypothetical protein